MTVETGPFNVNFSFFSKHQDMAMTCVGTPQIISPEIFKSESYSYKTDIWSLGCVLYEVCALRWAFHGHSMLEIGTAIIKGSYDPIPSSYSREIAAFIKVMLKQNPDE